MKYRHIGVLSLGHLATDINQGALPAMLPFFIAAYDLSYAAAAGIVFAANMTSSIIQPLFGHAADRFSKPWLLVAGLMLAGMGLALSGISPGYQWVMFLAIVSGIGIAAYHPEAARLVNFAAGTKKGTAMSLFGVGGTIGFPIGLVLYGTYSPSIVLGQNYLPNRVGFSSGVTLGVAVAIGGGAAPIIGRIADLYGIWFSLASIAFLPIVFFAIALSLPSSQEQVAKVDDATPNSTVQND